MHGHTYIKLGLMFDANIKLINTNYYSSDESNDITFWHNSTVS